MQHHFLAGSISDGFGLKRPQVDQLTQRSELVHQALGRTVHQLQHSFHPAGQFIQRFRSQGPGHAALGPEHVDEHRSLVSDDVLKQQGRPAALDHPVGDLRDLQLATDRCLDPAKLPTLFQKGDEIP